MPNSEENFLASFNLKLKEFDISFEEIKPLYFQFRFKSTSLNCEIIRENSQYLEYKPDFYIAFHDIVHQPDKSIAILKSKLGLNSTVFARKCIVKRISQADGSYFVNRYHLLGSVAYSYYVGIVYLDELIAVAAFSKGRKLNRLKVDERSYELIRFCCKDGYTITGGLSKLLNYFVKERNAAHIMTYTDNMLGEAISFAKIGFKKVELKAPLNYTIDAITFRKLPNKENQLKGSYVFTNLGSSKWVKYYSTQLL